ncbi:hypothetical protein SAMN05444266_101147 [Chitinophaga jiangningensis]|uniref:Uncharacterized protein n=1 Tax=Chitinophaga jiangningensis TaxID=1419482 RepID=A0A1M6VBZ8_9BACT|nr:hypothetical protein [Chitinophaga jiangningensis]SHK78901.1 hypothetical protein SAMN05444266_101147 [Chitinophaga jiangningensis]
MFFKFKPVYMEAVAIRALIFFAVLGVGLFLLDLDFSSKMALVSMILGLSSFLLLRMNLNEVLTMGVKEQELSLSFVNMSIYKKLPISVSLDKVSARKGNNVIRLLVDGKHVANLRRKAVSPEDWNAMTALFDNKVSGMSVR